MRLLYLVLVNRGERELLAVLLSFLGLICLMVFIISRARKDPRYELRKRARDGDAKAGLELYKLMRADLSDLGQRELFHDVLLLAANAGIREGVFLYVEDFMGWGSASASPRNQTCMRLLEQLVNIGDRQAALVLSEKLLSSDYGVRDYPRALSILENLASGGDREAALKLGRIHFYGDKEIRVDRTKALSWLERAAPDDPEVNRLIGIICLVGVEGGSAWATPMISRAYLHFHRAANGGLSPCRECQVGAAKLILNGDVIGDHQEAINLLHRAHDAECRAASAVLAEILYDGTCGKRDYPRALFYASVALKKQGRFVSECERDFWSDQADVVGQRRSDKLEAIVERLSCVRRLDDLPDSELAHFYRLLDLAEELVWHEHKSLSPDQKSIVIGSLSAEFDFLIGERAARKWAQFESEVAALRARFGQSTSGKSDFRMGGAEPWWFERGTLRSMRARVRS